MYYVLVNSGSDVQNVLIFLTFYLART